MKPWSRNEPMEVDVSGTAQFEGRTAEEAVARARAALGDSGALRCWKTRRGGVGGFFAKEVFVAGLTLPPGSGTTRGKASRLQPGQKRGGPDSARAADAAPQAGTTSVSAVGPVPQGMEDTSAGPEDHLSRLVESTSDQVSLGSLAIPAAAFDEVLAEAQAALLREQEGNGSAIPHTPAHPAPQAGAAEGRGVSERQRALPDDGEAEDPPNRRDAIAPRRPAPDNGERPASARPVKKTTRPKVKAERRSPAPRSSTATTHGQRGRPARMPELRPGLRRLGVPDEYMPRGQRPSLDQLASVMGTLPVPRPLPTRAGALVAVVGSGRDLDRTVDLVTAELLLGQREVLRWGGSPGAALVRPADAMSAEGRRLRRQIARRQASGRTALLAVEAGPGMPHEPEVRGLLQQAAPDYVLAAIGATCKRVDVQHWIDGLPGVDALALWDLSGTRTPAELLGALPIAFVDGEPSSPLAWTLALAGRVMERGGR
jgi:hypothetical protein